MVVASARIATPPLTRSRAGRPPSSPKIQALLSRSPEQRLGSGPRDSEDVKAHPFFDGLDWAALDRKEIPPPFNPGVDNPMDLKNFDPEFVNEPVPSSVLQGAETVRPGGGRRRGRRGESSHLTPACRARPQLSVRVSDAFEGFSFVRPGGLAGAADP